MVNTSMVDAGDDGAQQEMSVCVGRKPLGPGTRRGDERSGPRAAQVGAAEGPVGRVDELYPRVERPRQDFQDLDRPAAADDGLGEPFVQRDRPVEDGGVGVEAVVGSPFGVEQAAFSIATAAWPARPASRFTSAEANGWCRRRWAANNTPRISSRARKGTPTMECNCSSLTSLSAAG
jgi:hypothetical protein